MTDVVCLAIIKPWPQDTGLASPNDLIQILIRTFLISMCSRISAFDYQVIYHGVKRRIAASLEESRNLGELRYDATC
jgi:hypothetical protein